MPDSNGAPQRGKIGGALLFQSERQPNLRLENHALTTVSEQDTALGRPLAGVENPKPLPWEYTADYSGAATAEQAARLHI